MSITLSIIIPAFNEEKRLPATLQDIAKYLERSKVKNVEVIVVDDGSTDETVKVAHSLKRILPMLRVISYDQNQGKGYAVKMGMLASKGDYSLFMDADNSTPLSEIEKLWPFRDQFEVVIGSRHLKTSNVVIKQSTSRIIISRIGNKIIQLLLVAGITDTQCGFKLFQRDACKNIFSKQRTAGFGFDVEILTIAKQIFHYKVKEVPVSWYNSFDSRVRPIYHAMKTFGELLKIKWNLITGKYKA